jgi:hypothetical protein
MGGTAEGFGPVRARQRPRGRPVPVLRI